MGSPVATFETLIEEGMAHRNRARLAIGFEADRANDISPPYAKGFEGTLCLLVDAEIH
jgi:hypothetical protein